MISGLDLNSSVDYVLKNDKDPKTIWKLGVLPSYLFSRVSEDYQSKPMETVYKILQISLRGWENFGDIEFSTNKEMIFGEEINVVPMSLLNRLPLNIISELAMKVMEINKLSGDEIKN